MAQSSKMKPVQDPSRRSGGNRVLTIVVTVLGVGIVAALLFVGAALVVRLVSGPKTTPTPVWTLRPTFTPLAGVTNTAELVPTTAVAVVVPDPTVTATLTVAQPVETETPTVPPPTKKPTTQAPPTAKPTPAPPTATPRPPALSAKMTSPDYGIQAFLWWRPEIADRDLGLIRDAGFTWVKQWFAWSDIEGAGKGKYDWTTTDRIVKQAADFGLKLIVRVDDAPAWAGPPPGNGDHFASFLSAMAKRYKGRIQAYQVWNEPNLAREWGNKPPNAAEYTQMLKKAYQAIKKADPNAVVVSAGLAPTTELSQRAVPDTQFVQAMYKAGAKPYFDMLGAHGAGYKAPPEKDPGEVANDPNFYNVGDPNCPGPACRIYCFRHVEDLHQIMVDNGDANKRVVVLEFGWTIDERSNSPYYWHRVDDQFVQGDYMVRAYQYAKAHWQPWIALMSLIYMPDVKWTQNDEQYWWSVMEPSSIDQLNLKAPYVMLCLFIREVRGLGRCRYAP
jgi:hypothetical protein